MISSTDHGECWNNSSVDSPLASMHVSGHSDGRGYCSVAGSFLLIVVAAAGAVVPQRVILPR